MMINTLIRLAYAALLWLLLPLIFIYLFKRSRKQPEYLQHIPERFGFYAINTSKPIIWLHSVSVGETRAAAALVQRLLLAYPDHQILLTHTTPTGRATSEQLYGDKVLRVYLPYDYPFAVNRFLEHFKPALGILLETEIWFNLIHLCHRRHIPLLLLNARLSERSAARYARFPRMTRIALQGLTALAAQTQDDADRLQALGAQNVSVMGNLKFDIEPPPAMLELGQRLREQFGADRKVFLAASTREGEEELLLAALKSVHLPGLLIVIVPRHPQRFDAVATLIAQQGYRMQRRSENSAIAPETQIVLGDSMGEMFAYYTACDIAYIGGSLLPYGGQNLIEACAVGTPVLIGPHTFNFTQASERAIECGAAIRVHDSNELVAALASLLTAPARSSQVGKNGQGFVQANQGATDKALSLIALFRK